MGAPRWGLGLDWAGWGGFGRRRWPLDGDPTGQRRPLDEMPRQGRCSCVASARWRPKKSSFPPRVVVSFVSPVFSLVAALVCACFLLRSR